jgi:hypothetical protein
MLGAGYRHYHPDTQRKFSEFAPSRLIPGSVCALVVSVATRKGPDASPLCGVPPHGEDHGRVAGWGNRIRT